MEKWFLLVVISVWEDKGVEETRVCNFLEDYNYDFKFNIYLFFSLTIEESFD